MGVHPRGGVRSNEGAQLEKSRGIAAVGREVETFEQANDRPRRGIDNVGRILRAATGKCGDEGR